MAVDIDLVAIIKAELSVPGTPFANVWHLKTFQQLDATDVFPCVIYERVDDVPFEELDGNAGVFVATFAIHVCSFDDDVMRSMVDTLTNATGVYTSNGWMQWTTDNEQYETPVELQEIGVSITNLQVTMSRTGK